MGRTPKAPLVVYTIGHSNRSADELVSLLRSHGVQLVIDVRTIPRSRYNPQFNRADLARFLRNRRIGYRHLKALGGLRRARKDSPNTGWRNASFRGFADYMLTEDFAAALEELIACARRKTTAILCAEAVPWRCHRSLIADALTVRGSTGLTTGASTELAAGGLEVRHITSRTRAARHALSPMAKVTGRQITYPGEASLFGDGGMKTGTQLR